MRTRVVVAGLVLVMVLMAVPLRFASPVSASSNCDPQTPAASALSRNPASAIQVAASYANLLVANFSSTFDLLSTSTGACSPTVTSVNEVFLDGSKSVYYVVAMTPSFIPLRVSTQNATVFHASTTTTCCFSGWNSWAPSPYNAHANWRVPTVSNPPQLSCLFSVGCIASEWVGIENNAGTLIQGGTDANVFLEIYSLMWYEFYPSPAVTCTSVNPGDIVDSYVSQSSGVWNIYVDDQTNGQACSSSLSQTNVGAVAQFYMERPQGCGIFGCFNYHLPKFTRVQMTQIWINGFHPITNWNYEGDTIYNCNAYNINLGSPTNFDDFTQTWLTSACA